MSVGVRNVSEDVVKLPPSFFPPMQHYIYHNSDGKYTHREYYTEMQLVKVQDYPFCSRFS
jgi:hypothetical protein